jgi:hypothetical protein
MAMKSERRLLRPWRMMSNAPRGMVNLMGQMRGAQLLKEYSQILIERQANSHPFHNKMPQKIRKKGKVHVSPMLVGISAPQHAQGPEDHKTQFMSPNGGEIERIPQNDLPDDDKRDYPGEPQQYHPALLNNLVDNLD